MIHDLDETLRELLIQAVPIDPLLVDINFAMPGKDWAATIAKPTVNLFLYDVRENHDLRSSEPYVTRYDPNPDGTRGGNIKRPSVRVDLTYLISAWATEVDDEHKLLGDVLGGLLCYPELPQSVLKGAMANQPYPLHAWIAQPDRTPNAWDFWGGLDRMKASIGYVVTLAFDTTAPVEVRLVTEKVLKISTLSD